MPDNESETAKAAADRAARPARAAVRAAAVPDPGASAEGSGRSKRAAPGPRRKAPPATARTVRVTGRTRQDAPARQAEVKDEAKMFPARISHTLTYEQLEALEEVARDYRRAQGRAISLTAILRAASDICLGDAQLRERMTSDAWTYWTDQRPRTTRRR